MAKKMYLTEEHGKAEKVFETLVQLAAVVVLGLFLAEYLFFTARTESKSMEPSIQPESVLMVSRMAYAFEGPKRFDVVAFSREAGRINSDILVRRVIALPGETVKIEKGVVFINGEVLDLSAYTGEITSEGIAEEKIHLGSGEYFVLGDTPANSEDSRSSTIGPVTRAKIIGKVWLGAKSFTEIYTIR